VLNIKTCQDYVNWLLTNRLLINDHNFIVIDTKSSLIAGAFGINLLFGLLIPKELF
jgi:hypothetical protein